MRARSVHLVHERCVGRYAGDVPDVLRTAAELGLDCAGLDHLDLNAERPEFVPQTFRQALDREFSRIVDGVGRDRHDSADRRDIDEHAGLSIAEMRRDRLHARDEAEDVDVELTLNLLAPAGLDRPESAVAGVVEPHVDPTIGLDRLGDRGLRAFRILHVEPDQLEPRLLFKLLLGRRVAHSGDDVPALVEEEPRRRLAEAAAGAGDDDGLRRRVGHLTSSGRAPRSWF